MAVCEQNGDQVFYRFSKSTYIVVGATGVHVSFSRRAKPFDLYATFKDRLLYPRAVLFSYQSSSYQSLASHSLVLWRTVCDRTTDVCKPQYSIHTCYL